MRFEYIGKTNTVLEDIDIQSLKMGQTETVPAVALKFMTKKPNSFLNVLDPSGKLRAFLYEKNGNAAKTQQQLDGVEVISDLPQLTQNAVAMGNSFAWEYEQTGCTLVIYRGLGRAESNITLKDGTVRKLQVECMEGGTVHVSSVFYAANLDAETIGEIAVLKKHEVEIELTAPVLADEKQGSLGDGAQGSGKVTPIKKNGPQTPEEALAASLGQTATA